jgi:integrase
MAEREARDGQPPPAGKDDLTIMELCAAYWRFAVKYYCKDNERTSEVGCVRDALRRLKQLYGDTLVQSFGPLALKTARDRMVKDDLTRGTINAHTRRIIRMFRWGVEEELVDDRVHYRLQQVKALAKGRTQAREGKEVEPVEDSIIQQTLPHLSQVVSDMILVQRYTGMRPGEVCTLRPCDVNREGPSGTWLYVPMTHKTIHRGKQRIIVIPTKAQQILAKYLVRTENESFCFSPRSAEQERHDEERANRKTEPTPYEDRQWRERRRRKHARAPGERYDASSYRRAIVNACEKAGVEPWHPNRIRHTFATEVRRDCGIEAAQLLLGHSEPGTTLIYAERSLQTMCQAIQKLA